MFVDLPLNLSTKPDNSYKNHNTRHHQCNTPAATPSPTTPTSLVMRTTGPGIWSPASVLEAEQQTKIHSYIATHFIAQHHNIPLPLVNNATPLLQASLALANNNNNSIIKNNNGVGGKGLEGKSKNSRANNGKSSPAHAALIQNNSNGTKDLIGATHNHANTKGSRARASPVSVSSSTEVTVKTKKPKKSQNGSPRTFQVRLVYYNLLNYLKKLLNSSTIL